MSGAEAQAHLQDPVEKAAKLSLRLKADSGFSSTMDCRVSANQWGEINAIVDDGPKRAVMRAGDDLLAACVQAEAHLVELYRAISPKSEGRHADQDVSVQQLRAAIAKARGEA